MKKGVLIVDDIALNREILAEMLREDYAVYEATNGVEALEFIRYNSDLVTVVLLDLVMPVMGGLEVLEKMKKRRWLNKVQVLVISGEQDDIIETKCFEKGAYDFIRKPFNGRVVKQRVDKASELVWYKNYLEERVENQTKKLKKQTEKLKKVNSNILEVLGSMVESRDFESGEHIQRVKEYTRILALEIQKSYPEYELSDEKVKIMTEASALHDIGKIGIPDNVLLKPGRFTEEERLKMQEHSLIGYNLIQKLANICETEYVAMGSDIAHYHHERYDGNGYPEKLVGEEIPIAAQIVSVADCFDALVNRRVYKEAYSLDEAYKMLVNGECGAFSDKILKALKKSKKKFERTALRQR